MAQSLIRRVFIWIVALVALVIVGALGYCATHIPGGSDMDIANAVGRHIAAGYKKFDSRQQVERTDTGKIYYLSPGANGNPSIKFYEITSAEDQQQIEALARSAFKAVPGANSITLIFYKAQNLRRASNGGGTRGAEEQLKRVRLKREFS